MRGRVFVAELRVVRVLLVAGADDSKFTAVARAMAARLPDATVAIVADAGHNVHLEQPQRFTALVAEFLAGE